MKTAFVGFALLIFALAHVHAGESAKIDAFATIPFGASIEQAKAAMDEHGVVFEKKKSTPTHLQFSGGMFGLEEVGSWDLFFVDGKFFKGVISIGNPATARLQRYHRVKQRLTDKYGPPLKSQPNEKDESTMDEAEVYRMVGSGKASVQERWKIGNGSILCKISKVNRNVRTTVTYQDDALAALAENEQKGDL